ncbi:hypothetical protein ABZ749_32405, partial [Micromonospora sp. NPDC047753]
MSRRGLLTGGALAAGGALAGGAAIATTRTGGGQPPAAADTTPVASVGPRVDGRVEQVHQYVRQHHEDRG